MTNKKDITESELEIMNFIWDSNKVMSLKEITDYFIDEKKKDWKKQTVRAFLIRLKDKGYLKMLINPDNNKYVYVAIKDKNEYLQNFSNNIINKFFKGSVSEFFISFTGKNEISKDEIEKLRAILKE